MSDATPVLKLPQKLLFLCKKAPIWLWLSTIVSFIILVVSIMYISQQSPDQYAMTLTPPWNHGMNYQELVAMHTTMKRKGLHGDEQSIRESMYRQSESQALLGYSDTRYLERKNPHRALMSEDRLSFQRGLNPPNKDILNEAQLYAQIERNRFADTSSHFVQTASLSNEEDAQSLRAQLIMKGFDPFIQTALVKNKTWYRVRLGPFETVSDARKAMKQLKRARHPAQLIKARQ